MAESNEVMKVITGARGTLTRAWVTISEDNEEVHEGNAFTISNGTTSVAASSAIYVQINTPSTSGVHVSHMGVYSIDTLSRFTLLEATTNSTFATGTTPIIPWNKRRASTNTAQTVFFSNPTLVNSTNSSMINILSSIVIGSSGSQPGGKISSMVSLEDEWVLKPNTTYILEIKNIGATIGQLGYTLFWYVNGY